jgi:hypothetical protein
MFVYVDDKAATINVAFDAKVPVENPEVVIQGFKNGAKVLVNGAVAVDVADAEKFDSIRRPFIYQKDDKLNVTFQATSPVEAPEVVIDSIADDKVSITANGTTIRVTYTDEGVTYEAPAASTRKSRKSTPAPAVEETPVVEEVVSEVTEA